MGGIGKTTLAKHVYKLHCREFNRNSFVENIVHDVSMYTSTIENALSHKKVLVVLNDIDSLDQLDALPGNKGFHPGSKIIITTKDTSLTERRALFKQVQPKHVGIVAFRAINARRLPLAPLVYTLVRPSYRQLKIVLSIEDKLNYLEQPIPPAPVALESQQVAPEILAAHTAWIKGSKEIAGLMLMTMEPEIQQNLENLHANEMLKELKTLFAQQAEQELLQTTRDFHSCKQEEGQLVSSYVMKIKGYIDKLEHLGHPVTLGLGEWIVLKFTKITKNRTISTQDQKPQRKAGSRSKFSSNNLTMKLKLSKFQTPAGQHVAPDILAAHNAWIKGLKEIVGLMLLTMKPKIQRNMESLHAHEMLRELKTLFAQQAEQELLRLREIFTLAGRK
nr:zinc finger, CCHC-type [Tanacetum cinerariifolium]